MPSVHDIAHVLATAGIVCGVLLALAWCCEHHALPCWRWLRAARRWWRDSGDRQALRARRVGAAARRGLSGHGPSMPVTIPKVTGVPDASRNLEMPPATAARSVS